MMTFLKLFQTASGSIKFAAVFCYSCCIWKASCHIWTSGFALDLGIPTCMFSNEKVSFTRHFAIRIWNFDEFVPFAYLKMIMSYQFCKVKSDFCLINQIVEQMTTITSFIFVTESVAIRRFCTFASTTFEIIQWVWPNPGCWSNPWTCTTVVFSRCI